MPKGAKYKPKTVDELRNFLKNGVECRDIDFSGLDDLSNLFQDHEDILLQSNVYFVDPENPDELIWNTENVKNMRHMFYDCENFNKPVRLDTRKVESFSSMFKGCASFNQEINFNTDNVEHFKSMFAHCINFNSPVKFTDTSKVRSFYFMFFNCSSFNQAIDFDCSNATAMENMFRNCKVLNKPIKLKNMGKNNWQKINENKTFMRFFSQAFDGCESLKEWNLIYLDFDRNIKFNKRHFEKVYNGLTGTKFKSFLSQIKRKYKVMMKNEKLQKFLDI